MSKKIVNLPQMASPTIEQVLDEFLADQRKRVRPKTLRQYEDVIGLLKSCLNSYAYQSLTKAESGLFEKHFNAEGEQHREFCQIFGSDKILENLGEFLGYFMIRKVVAGETLMRAAGSVTKKLSKWLADSGCVSQTDSKKGMQVGREFARDLPKAERAARVLYESTRSLPIEPTGIDEENYIDFDHYVISRIESGKIWLECSYEAGTFGPIPVPVKATGLLAEGWEISCSLGRIRRKWRIVEMGNVYPS